MTKKEFSHYRFSIATRVQFKGKWYSLKDIFFDKYLVGLNPLGMVIHCLEIEDIKEESNL